MISTSSLFLAAGSLMAIYGFASAAVNMIPWDDKYKNKICKVKELEDVQGDGFILSKNLRISKKQSNEHVLLLAPTGAGKTRRVIMPNVNNLKNCSIVVTDPSCEIYKTCKITHKSYIFNPFSDDTIGYNPLENCHSEFEVRNMVQTILINGMSDAENGKQKEWVDMGSLLVNAYCLYNYATKKYNFYELIERLCTCDIMPIYKKVQVETGEMKTVKVQSYETIGEEILNSGIDSAIVEFEMFLQVGAAQQTLSSIRIVLNTCLRLFMDENVKKILCKSSIDIAILRKKETALFIQIPDRYAEYYKPLTATLVSQIFDTLFVTRGLQVYVMFDEFANIGAITNICSVLSTARKYDIPILASIQSLPQFKRVYGDRIGNELSELFKTLVVCSGLKDISADYVSSLVGMTRKTTKGTETIEQVMTTDDVRRMNSDEVLIVINNRRAVSDIACDIVI